MKRHCHFVDRLTQHHVKFSLIYKLIVIFPKIPISNKFNIRVNIKFTWENKHAKIAKKTLKKPTKDLNPPNYKASII